MKSSVNYFKKEFPQQKTPAAGTSKVIRVQSRSKPRETDTNEGYWRWVARRICFQEYYILLYYIIYLITAFRSPNTFAKTILYPMKNTRTIPLDVIFRFQNGFRLDNQSSLLWVSPLLSIIDTSNSTDYFWTTKKWFDGLLTSRAPENDNPEFVTIRT